MEPRRDTSVRDLLTILFKQKHKIVITFIAVVIVITGISLLLPPVYEAKSTLLVKFGREYLYKPEVGDARTMTLTAGQEELVNSEIQILTNRDLIERVVTTLGVKTLYPSLSDSPAEQAIMQFRKGLFAEALKKSNVIQVAYRHSNPEVSSKALNLLVDLFREKHLQIYSDTKSSFLEAQLTSFGGRLKEAEDNLEAFKQKHRVFSLDEQRTALLKQRTDLDNTLKETDSRIGEARMRISSLAAQLEKVASQVPVSSEPERARIVDDAQSQLLTLKLREQELTEKYREDNRLVVNVKREIALLEAFLKKQEEQHAKRVITGRNVIHEEMERDLVKARAEVSSLQAKKASVTSQLALVDAEMKGLDQKGNELAGLKREVASNEKNYQIYLERVEEARISDTMNRQKMANVTIIQPATLPVEPVKPRLGYNFLLALVIGCVSGLGLGFVSEYTSQSLSTPENVERRIALPVLATVPYKG